jgi:hypothetical protein
LKWVVTSPSFGCVGKLGAKGSLARSARAHQVIFLLQTSLPGVRRFDDAYRVGYPSRERNSELPCLTGEGEECRARNKRVRAEKIRPDGSVFHSRQSVYRPHCVRFAAYMADEWRAPHRSIDANTDHETGSGFASGSDIALPP